MSVVESQGVGVASTEAIVNGRRPLTSSSNNTNGSSSSGLKPALLPVSAVVYQTTTMMTVEAHDIDLVGDNKSKDSATFLTTTRYFKGPAGDEVSGIPKVHEQVWR